MRSPPDAADFAGGPAIHQGRRIEVNYLGVIVALVVPVVTVLAAVILWVAVWGPMVKNARAVMWAQTATPTLCAAGVPAQARILGVRPTGHMTNFTPQCQIEMDVYSPNTPPYRVSVLGEIPPIASPRVQPGLVVPVKVDRRDPANVVLNL
jgi:hypothetical protein